MKKSKAVKKKKGAVRFNSGKAALMFNDLGKEVRELEAAVWLNGTEIGGYSPGNWLKGQSALDAYSSMKRHMTALLDPNESDFDDTPAPDGKEGSGLHHGGHLICSVKIFVNAIVGNDGAFDDRIKPY